MHSLLEDSCFDNLFLSESDAPWGSAIAGITGIRVVAKRTLSFVETANDVLLDWLW